MLLKLTWKCYLSGHILVTFYYDFCLSSQATNSRAIFPKPWYRNYNPKLITSQKYYLERNVKVI